MKTDVYSIEGKKLKQITLPEQFSEPVRPDLIKRAVLAVQSKKITPYGAAPRAGKRASAYVSKRRRRYKGIYGRGGSRTPRKVMTGRGLNFFYVGAFSPNTVGGRRAHPPKSEKNWTLKINKQEKLKAIRSALAATVIKDLVTARGHKVEDLKQVIESKVERIAKTKDAKKFLLSLGLEKELSRTKEKKVRAGKGKSRGRKYKRKTGPLILVSKECPLRKAASGIQGVNVHLIKNVNTELLAPGTIPGRLTIYTEDSLKLLQEKNLFLQKAKDKKPKEKKENKK